MTVKDLLTLYVPFNEDLRTFCYILQNAWGNDPKGKLLEISISADSAITKYGDRIVKAFTVDREQYTPSYELSDEFYSVGIVIE